jgi:hypothetical protein
VRVQTSTLEEPRDVIRVDFGDSVVKAGRNRPGSKDGILEAAVPLEGCLESAHRVESLRSHIGCRSA